VADRNDQTEEAREPHEHDGRHGQSIAKRSDSHIASRTRRPRTLERARTLARAQGISAGAWRGKPSVCAARPPARDEKAAAGLRSATVFQRPVALRACRSGRDTQPVRQMSLPVALCPLLGEQRKPYARIDLFGF